jgi:hypothetical protein
MRRRTSIEAPVGNYVRQLMAEYLSQERSRRIAEQGV